MKNFLLITVVLISGALHSLAVAGYTAQWHKADSFYEQKQYDSAAWNFEQIAALHPRNAELYYNMGNTYYRLNRVGLAVLSFQRALAINPDLKEAKDNLALSEARIGNRILPVGDIFFIKWWDAATMPHNATLWAVVTLVLFFTIIMIMLARRFSKPGRHIPRQLPGVLGFTCFCFFFLSFCASRNSEEHAMAVVMEADAPLMNREIKGRPITLVPEGTTVKITGRKDKWLEVRLPDGRDGWLMQSQLEKI